MLPDKRGSFMLTRLVRVAALMGILGPLAAGAADLVVISSGANAFADFTTSDACVTTTVHLEAGSQFVRVPSAVPQPSASTGAFIIITRMDACSGTTIALQGFSQDVTYTFDRLLTQAHLTGPIEACDPDTGLSCVTLSVDLVWSGVGLLGNLRNNNRQISGAFIFIAMLVGEARSAIVTGTVSDGTTNYTPGPSDAAFMAWVTTHEVFVHRQ